MNADFGRRGRAKGLGVRGVELFEYCVVQLAHPKRQTKQLLGRVLFGQRVQNLIDFGVRRGSG